MNFKKSPLVRIVIADDHRLLPEAVRALLEPDADIEVAGVTYEADRILPPRPTCDPASPATTLRVAPRQPLFL